jgi:hypothetical protein
VAENGTTFIVDVAQTADEEGHITCPSAYRFGGQMLPNAAKYSYVFSNLIV